MKTKNLENLREELLRIQAEIDSLEHPSLSPEEAFVFIMEQLKAREPSYTPDFTNNVNKWSPVYDHPNDTFVLKAVIKTMSAPAHWYWPKGAWEYIIRTYPQELRLAFGVRR